MNNQIRKEFIRVNSTLEETKSKLIEVKLLVKEIEKWGINYDVDDVLKELNKIKDELNNIKSYNLLKYRQHYGE